jgi:hypothetical protein
VPPLSALLLLSLLPCLLFLELMNRGADGYQRSGDVGARYVARGLAGKLVHSSAIRLSQKSFSTQHALSCQTSLAAL